MSVKDCFQNRLRLANLPPLPNFAPRPKFISMPSTIKEHPPKLLYKNCVLKNLTKFSGKHLRQGLFLNKVEYEMCAANFLFLYWHFSVVPFPNVFSDHMITYISTKCTFQSKLYIRSLIIEVREELWAISQIAYFREKNMLGFIFNLYCTLNETKD